MKNKLGGLIHKTGEIIWIAALLALIALCVWKLLGLFGEMADQDWGAAMTTNLLESRKPVHV